MSKQKLLNKFTELKTKSCERCINNYPSLGDHSCCFINFFDIFNIFSALEILYENSEITQEFYDHHKILLSDEKELAKFITNGSKAN
jgi:hypothetical protein